MQIMTFVKKIPVVPFLKQERNANFAHETTFASAFRHPGPNYRAVKLCSPPKPSHIMTSNSTAQIDTADMYQSTTRETYLPITKLSREANNNFKNIVYDTHFKMDADSRMNTFKTNSQLEYPYRLIDTPLREYSQHSVLKLSNPNMLGSNHKSPEISEYVDMFTPQHRLHTCTHYTVVGNVTAQKMKLKLIEDHVKARDNENTKFITTSMSDYKGHTTNSSSLSPTAINQQKRKSNITFGDHNIINHMYKQCNNIHKFGEITYNKKEAHEATYSSSIKLGDVKFAYCDKFSDYPHYHNPERRYPVTLDQNVSSFPVGDLDADRLKERLSKNMFIKPPQNSFPSHVKGAHIRTHSSVHFGQTLFHSSHKSTAKDSYLPIKMKVKHMHAPRKDNIVFGYRPDKGACSVMHESYDLKSFSQIEKPSQKALENLKKSHWKSPTGAISFLTTHQNDFHHYQLCKVKN